MGEDPFSSAPLTVDGVTVKPTWPLDAGHIPAGEVDEAVQEFYFCPLDRVEFRSFKE